MADAHTMTGHTAETERRGAPLLDAEATSAVDAWRVRRRLLDTVLHPVAASWAGIPGVVAPSGVLLHGPDADRAESLVVAISGALDLPTARIDVGELLDDPGTTTPEEIAGSIIRTAGPGRSIIHAVNLESADERDRNGARASELLAAGLRELQSGEPGERALLVAISSRPWEIAPGLLLAGAFDRTIFLAPPDWDGRHRQLVAAWGDAERVPGIERVIAATEGWSLADLDALIDCVHPANDDGSLEQLVAAATATTPSSAEWLDRSRQMANYAVDLGRYDDLLGYLRRYRIA